MLQYSLSYCCFKSFCFSNHHQRNLCTVNTVTQITAVFKWFQFFSRLESKLMEFCGSFVVCMRVQSDACNNQHAYDLCTQIKSTEKNERLKRIRNCYWKRSSGQANALRFWPPINQFYFITSTIAYIASKLYFHCIKWKMVFYQASTACLMLQNANVFGSSGPLFTLFFVSACTEMNHEFSAHIQ